MSVARPIRALCSVPVSWAGSEADGRCSSFLAGRPEGLRCIIGGNLEGGTGDTSTGETGMPGDICVEPGACETSGWFQADAGGLKVGEGITLEGCLALLRIKNPGLSVCMRRC